MTLDMLPRMRGALLLATAAAFLLCSCAEDDAGIIEGTVTVNGGLAAGVEVTLTGEGIDLFEITGILGEYAFEVPPGTYTVDLTDGLAPNVECSPEFPQEVEVSIDVITVQNFACDTSSANDGG